MHKTYQLLLAILANAETPFTRNDIWDKLTIADRKQFNSGVDSISSAMYALVMKKRWVATSGNKQVGNKSVVTYVITDKGLADYNAFKKSQATEAEDNKASNAVLTQAVEVGTDPALPVKTYPLSAITGTDSGKGDDRTAVNPELTLDHVLNYAQEAASNAMTAAAIVKSVIDNASLNAVTVPKVKNKAATLSVLRNVAYMVKHEYSERLCYVADIIQTLEDE
jgi:hypothetical protein